MYTIIIEQKTLNSRKGQRTNQKYRNLVGSDRQMQRLEETDLRKGKQMPALSSCVVLTCLSPRARAQSRSSFVIVFQVRRFRLSLLPSHPLTRVHWKCDCTPLSSQPLCQYSLDGCFTSVEYSSVVFCACYFVTALGVVLEQSSLSVPLH